MGAAENRQHPCAGDAPKPRRDLVPSFISENLKPLFSKAKLRPKPVLKDIHYKTVFLRKKGTETA